MPFPILKGDTIRQDLQFALLLRDAFADSDQLLGQVTAKSGIVSGQQKDSSGVFLFYTLKPGAQSIQVTSGPETPYYLPASINVTIPMGSAVWPAFPDINLADPNLPLGDPSQPAAYKTQRLAATLLPANSYPFLAGSTLIRGTVRHNNNPLSGATVQQVGGIDPSYKTGDDGQFVLFISKPPGTPTQITLTATYPALAGTSVKVTVMRGLTVPVTINM